MHLQRVQRIPDAMVLTGGTLRNSWILKVGSLICCKSEASPHSSHPLWHSQKALTSSTLQPGPQSLELNSESVMMGSPKQPLPGQCKMSSGLLTAAFLEKLFLNFSKSFLLTRGP